ncbi:hypothetical protein GLA29479_5025 [Lysobacter antibioticus]|nr:hypothetical protein GLA29479_5025 [Lysobacter antibioticus]
MRDGAQRQKNLYANANASANANRDIPARRIPPFEKGG